MITNLSYVASYFWPIVALLIRKLNMHFVFFIIHFIGRFIMLYSVFKLSEILFKNRILSYFSSIFFLGYINTYLGTDSISWYYTTHTSFAFGLFSLALYLFLKKRFELAILLAGLSFNIHALYGVFVIIMFAGYYLVNCKRLGLKRILLSIGILILTSLPTILWLCKLVSFKYDINSWLLIQRLRSSHHIFPFSWEIEKWIPFFFFSSFLLLAFRYKAGKEEHRMVKIFIAAILVMWIMGTIFSEIIPFPLIIRLQLFRSNNFFILFALLYVSNYIFKSLSSAHWDRFFVGCGLFTALVLSQGYPISLILFFIFSLSLDIRDYAKNGKYTKFQSFLSWFLFFIPAIIFLGLILKKSYPIIIASIKFDVPFMVMILLAFFISIIYISRINLCRLIFRKLSARKLLFSLIILVLIISSVIECYHRYRNNGNVLAVLNISEWKDVQLWCKSHSKKDAVFITPPYLKGFRIFSERATFSEWKDGTIGLISPTFSIVWWDRMQAMGIEQKQEVKSTYNKLTEKDFSKLADKYKLDYVITKKPKKLSFNKLYENKQFNVYYIDRLRRISKQSTTE
jgi:hypothetical protein